MKLSLFLVTATIGLLVCSIGCHNSKLPTAESRQMATPGVEAFRPGALGMQPPLLTKHEQLDKYVGQVVAIRGIVSNTKIASIIGVDVEPGDLRGEDCYAVGILAKSTTTRGQLDELVETRGVIAARGPGTTYSLHFDLSGKISAARKWPHYPDTKTK